jgi:hypothetical protein
MLFLYCISEKHASRIGVNVHYVSREKDTSVLKGVGAGRDQAQSICYKWMQKEAKSKIINYHQQTELFIRLHTIRKNNNNNSRK